MIILLYEFSSYTLPNSVFVNDKNTVELPKIEIYYKKFPGKKQDLLFLAGDVQPIDEVSCYEFCDTVLDILQEFGSLPSSLDYYSFSPEQYWVLNRLKLSIPSAYLIRGINYQENSPLVNFSVLDQIDSIVDAENLTLVSQVSALFNLGKSKDLSDYNINERSREAIETIRDAYKITIGTVNLETRTTIFGDEI